MITALLRNWSQAHPAPATGRRWLQGVRALILAAVAGTGFLLEASAATNGQPRVAGADPADVERKPFNFAFSQRIFSQVNENDAQASVRAWALALSRERSVLLEARPVIITDAAELNRALTNAGIDGGACLTPEFLELDPKSVDDELFLSIVSGRTDEEYVLAVRSDSSFADVRQLKGRELIVHANPRMALSSAWLTTLLAGQGLDAPGEHFSRVSPVSRLPQVVLPVFFGQKDACLVTRSGFDSMAELNPQVRNRLRIIATSPTLVPAVGFFRAGLPPEQRAEMIRAMRHLEDSPSGRQVLTHFQTSGLVVTNAAALNSAREILRSARGR